VEKKKAECKKAEIKELVGLGRSYFEELRTAIDFSKILQLTFQVDTLKFSSTWLSCKSYSESLISKEEVYQLTDTTSCFVSNRTSPEWLEDPCCNTGILWKACCLPRPYNISTQLYIEPDIHKISGECQNSDCVASYISDLIELDINQFQCATFKSEEYPKLVDKSQQFYVDCKNKFNIDAISLGEAACHSDAECRFGGLSNKVSYLLSFSLLTSSMSNPISPEFSKCNLVTGRCIASRELELATLHCIVDGMNLYTESYFKDILSLPGRKKDSEFFNTFVDHFSVRDCRNNLGHQSTLRDGELFVVMDSKCAGPYGCKFDSCLDSTCTITGTACFLNCQMFWAESDSTKVRLNNLFFSPLLFRLHSFLIPSFPPSKGILSRTEEM
jgi:hypothetical protein